MKPFNFRHKDKTDTLYKATQHPDDYSICVVSWTDGERQYPVEKVNELVDRKVWVKQ